jgi:hypothetical protein
MMMTPAAEAAASQATARASSPHVVTVSVRLTITRPREQDRGFAAPVLEPRLRRATSRCARLMGLRGGAVGARAEDELTITGRRERRDPTPTPTPTVCGR